LSSSGAGFLTFHFLGFVDIVNEQVSFVWVFLQESITGKGMLQGIEHGDHASIVSLGLFCMLIATLAVSFVLAPPPETKEPARKLKAPRPAGWSDMNAFQRAKSVAKLLDPSRNVDDLILNFNDGRPPFGLKKNAENWNGRIAMVSSVATLRTCDESIESTSILGNDIINLTKIWLSSFRFLSCGSLRRK